MKEINILLEKVRQEIEMEAQKGFAYTSINHVPNGKNLLAECKKNSVVLHERYLFGGLRFVNI